MTGRRALARQRVSRLASHLTLAGVATWYVALASTLVSLVNVRVGYSGADGGPEAQFQALVIASFVAMFAVLWLVRRAVGVQIASQPRPVLVVGLLGVLATVRAVALDRAMQGLGSPGMTPGQWAWSTAGVVLVILTVAVLVDTARQEAVRGRRIESLQQAMDEWPADSDALLRAQRATVVAAANEAILPDAESLRGAHKEDAVDSLRRVAHDVVRPMSHELIADPGEVPTPSVSVLDYRLDLRSLLSDATAGGRLPAFSLTVALIAITIAYNVSYSSTGVPWLAVLVNSMLVLGWTGTFNLTLAPLTARKGTSDRIAILTASLLMLGLGTWWFTESLVSSWAESVGLRPWLALGVVPVVGWVILLFKGASAQHRRSAAVEQALEEQLHWEVARANSRLRAQGRDLARQLHGPVQVELNAAAFRVSRSAGPTVDPALAASIEDGIKAALADLGQAGQSQPDLPVAIERVRGIWDGLCEVDVHDPHSLVPTLGVDPTAASAATDIITEACSDAVRHGRASRIEVALTRPREDVIRIEVEDNGVGMQGGVPGLGSTLLSSVSLEWTREAAPEGTRLVVDLPFAVT